MNVHSETKFHLFFKNFSIFWSYILYIKDNMVSSSLSILSVMIFELISIWFDFDISFF